MNARPNIRQRFCEVVEQRALGGVASPKADPSADPFGALSRAPFLFPQVRWVADYDGETTISLDSVDGSCLASKCWGKCLERKLLFRVARGLKAIGQVDPYMLIAPEPVTGLVELQPNLEMRDRVRRHEQF